MATEIGSSSFFSTWLVCRTAIGNGGSGLSGGGAHNEVWASGFKTTEGNGFVRCDAEAKFAFAGSYVVFDDTYLLFYLSNASSFIVMNQAEANELIGETVTTTGGSFAISADYLNAGGQAVGGSAGFAPITAIGKLTAL